MVLVDFDRLLYNDKVKLKEVSVEIRQRVGQFLSGFQVGVCKKAVDMNMDKVLLKNTYQV